MTILRRVVHPPVGGIAIVHELTFPLRFDDPGAGRWPGSRETAEPVTVRHVVGGDGVDGFAEVLDTQPWQTFYRDADGRTAIRFHAVNERIPASTLRTVEQGRRYEMRHPEVPERPIDHRGRDQVVLTIALPTRETGALVHGCGFLMPSGRAVLCPGVSGRGKSTLARLLREARPDVRILSDDRCVVTRDVGGMRVWGTPWPGEQGAIDHADAPLGAMLLIGRAAAPSLRRAERREVARVLLDTVVLPLWEPPLLASTLEFVDRLTLSAPGYFFDYPPEPASIGWLIERLSAAVVVNA